MSIPAYDHKTRVVRARCPDCDGALSTFFPYPPQNGVIIERHWRHFVGQRLCEMAQYRLMLCGGCGRGALAVVHDVGGTATLDGFYPSSVDVAQLPSGIPKGIVAEVREAELCASVNAWRAASVLLRSALEKTLRANGYNDGTLQARIDAAARDGLITASLRERAHGNVRDLGNDVAHEDWRPVTPEEYTGAHRYVQRIIEAFYDHRDTVLAILKGANRNVAEPPKTDG